METQNNVQNLDERIYFTPGDVVTIRLDIPNKPIMLVVRKKTFSIKGNEVGKCLQGIVCRWFTTDQHMEENIFSTKDLILVNK